MKKLIADLENRLARLEGQLHSVDILAKNVVNCQKVDLELQQRLEFEEIVTEISTEFINLLPSDITNGINRALCKVGEFAAADRCYVFQLSDDGCTMTNTHEYCAAGVKPQIGKMAEVDTAAFGWAIKELKTKGFLRVSEEADFPAHAVNEKKQFVCEGVRAFIVFAMKFEEQLTGFVGFDWLNTVENCSERVASLLLVLGGIFANALQRQKDEQDKEALIKELCKTQDELLTLSIRDQLTGLFNRRHMEESLRREISRAARYDSTLSIIMIDVDYFKKINDLFGHMAGDIVLSKLGEFLAGRFRGEDVACRYGGEEFILIMPGADKGSGLKKAKELRRQIAEHLQIEYRNKALPSITVSMGVASYPDDGITVDGLLYEVDNALYKAKEGGRNRVETV